jgi:hypothetical protein
MQAACHHGGAGTTGASLRGMVAFFELEAIELTDSQPSWHTNHHTPIFRRSVRLDTTANNTYIVLILLSRRFFWADRVEALGVGTGLRKFTADSLAKALKAATTDEKQLSKAAALGKSIRQVRIF